MPASSKNSFYRRSQVFSDGPKQFSAEVSAEVSAQISVIRTEISVCKHYKEMTFCSELSKIFFLNFARNEYFHPNASISLKTVLKWVVPNKKKVYIIC